MPAVDVLAIDLGASTGRVARIRVAGDGVLVLATHRFPTALTPVDGLRWDVWQLLRDILAGCRAVIQGAEPPSSLAIDSWGVDYGLLGSDGSLLQQPFSYRDPRTRHLHHKINQPRAYATSGIPGQDINTATQLLAEHPATLARAARLLPVPDLIRYLLTDDISTEATIASTTQLFDAEVGWSTELIEGVGVRPDLFPDIRRHSETVGTLQPGRLATIGLQTELPTICIGSHDTASAIAATPILEDDVAYISCGTWACVGAELGQPILTEDARLAGFANEQGIDGAINFHRSSMGLWPLQECLRCWDVDDPAPLLLEAKSLAPSPSMIDINDPSLFDRQDMPAAISCLCRASGVAVPTSRAALVRCILDSLAIALSGHVADLDSVLGRPSRKINLVGGGAHNDQLCQNLADVSGLTVIAGPAEATLLGNALVQARAFGGPATVPQMRELVAKTVQPRMFEPQ